jgi:hypothetical protein
MDAWPELSGLRETLKMSQEKPSVTKIAELMERHVTEETAVSNLLKEAMELRGEYEHFTAGLDWINKNMPAVAA